MEQDRPRDPVERDRHHEPPPAEPPPEDAPPEEPVPGIEHRPEPDAENIIPVKHEPGTL
jgi:hypothetical protein